MKNLLYILLFIFTCCHSNKTKTNINGYPAEISYNKLEAHYNKTKWLLYCLSCDKKYVLSELVKIKDSSFYGFTNLKFTNLEFHHDTIEIKMDYYYNDSIKCNVNTVFRWTPVKTSAFYKGSADSLIYFRDDTNFILFINKEQINSREINPLQPEVISFIRKNKDKLNPWFREEARIRKVIE